MELGIIIFKLLFILLTTLFILISIFLLAPLSYAVRIEKAENTNAQIDIKWCFGIIEVSFIYKYGKKEYVLGVFGIKKYFNQLNFKFSNSRKKLLNNKKIKNRNIFSKESINKEIMLEIYNLFNNILRSLKPKEISGYIVYGTGSPFYDAMIDGVKMSLLSFFPNLSLNLYPSFTQETIEGKLMIKGVLFPVTFLLIMFSFIFKKPIRKVIFKKEEKNVI